VQEVVVRGWDPAGHEFVGQAAAPTILLEPGEPQPDLVLGATLSFTVDHPIFSVEEASAIAKAKLEELLLTYVTGEAQSTGNPKLKAGILVSIEGSDGHFNGKYHVVGTSHRYSHGQVCGGYKTMFKVRRDGGGLFFLPEVDDEVLVAFAHGDITQPFVVGSMFELGGACGAPPRPPLAPRE
jgi:hypothetical protein